jgi:hypothetical protein
MQQDKYIWEILVITEMRVALSSTWTKQTFTPHKKKKKGIRGVMVQM